MEEYHQITLDEWTSWKEDIRKRLTEAVQNFVYIGYRLKQIRDSGMFGGTANIFEFAEKEYGLSKSTVSRFIAINEKYSEGGNSLELKEQYKNFTSSKLSEMLSLPDSECEMITENTTVRDIRKLKEFGRQQESDFDIHEPPLKTCVVDFFKDKKDMLNEVLQLIYDGKEKEAAECMNPSGVGTHSKGICFLFMYEYEKGIKYKLLMEPQPLSMTWHEFLENIFAEYEYEFKLGAYDVWSQYYKNEDVVATVATESPEAQEPQQPEPIAENENPVNEPLSEEAKIEEPVNEMDEGTSEKVENEEEPINTEEENTENAESQELQNSELLRQSQQEEEKPKEEIKNNAAFQNAKDALARANEAFNEGQYQRAMDMADAFIFHLERATK
jgi:hypothetical protein